VEKKVIEENGCLDVENIKAIRKSGEVQIEANFQGH